MIETAAEPTTIGIDLAKSVFQVDGWAPASALFSWAKIVFSIAATAVRCLAGAWASAFLIQ